MKQIGPWIYDEEIGRGGQCKVYSAYNSNSEGEELVAIKIIKASKPKRKSRFIQEIEAHVKLSDKETKNIIKIIDHNIEKSPGGKIRGYIVMPRAKGSLEDFLETIKGRTELVLDIFIGIVNGIKNAHSEDIIHRDIKPANILFLDKSLKNPLISDFGICLLKDMPDQKRITGIKETVGAKFFMAPEQERGGIVDVRFSADIYALGKLLHYMLTGRTLHREKLNEAFNSEELEEDPRLRIIRDEIFSKTIVENPEDRIQTADELFDLTMKIINSFKNRQGISESRQEEDNKKVLPKSELSLNESYEEYIKKIVNGDIKEIDLEFDKLKKEFEDKWEKMYVKIKDNPKSTPSAAEELIIINPKMISIALSMTRFDSIDLFIPFKRLLEKITYISGELGFYNSVNSVPCLESGFLYMVSSMFALENHAWALLNKLLNSKFEVYFAPSQPAFEYGFANHYFFHPKALDHNGAKAHDLFRKIIKTPDFLKVTGLDEDNILNLYLQTHMLMNLKAAQLFLSDEDTKVWADFGRFYPHRVEPLLTRIQNTDDYNGVLESFAETKEEFFNKLNERLEIIQKRFFPNSSGYPYQSIIHWPVG